MDEGAWWATVHGLAKSQTQLRDFHIHTYRKLGVSILEGKMVHAVDGKKQN